MEIAQHYIKRMLKMSYPSNQLSIANSLPAVGPTPFCGKRSKQLATSLRVSILHFFHRNPKHPLLCSVTHKIRFLLIETTLVTFAAILAIKVFDGSYLSRATWFVAPGILVAAAIIPTAIKRRKFAEIGFNLEQIRSSLVVLGWTCVVVFPITVCGLWLLKSYGLDLLLQPVPLQNQEWACLLFYQFMYVAVAEEVFFRGYVQSNILRLTKIVKPEQCKPRQWISIVTSAAVFAVAHIIVTGEIISVLTFLPGLILGWLFIRTRSLLAPILFHGLANTCYFCVAAVFA